MRILTFIFCLLLFLGIAAANGAELKNLHSGQDVKRAFLQYDLTGMPGEKEAEVAIRVEVAGVFYTPSQLSLSGDFGKKVKIGVARRIWWDLLTDMPAGYEGEIGWDIEVMHEPKQLPLEREQKAELSTHKIKQLPGRPIIAHNNNHIAPFLVDALTLSDMATGLVWTRNANLASGKLTFDKARDFARKLNRENYAGFSDWRLPSAAEFMQLFATAKKAADATGKKPIKIIQENFEDYQLWYYWTRKTFLHVGPNPAERAVVFDLEYGTKSTVKKSEDHCILAVRGRLINDEDKN